MHDKQTISASIIYLAGCLRYQSAAFVVYHADQGRAQSGYGWFQEPT